MAYSKKYIHSYATPIANKKIKSQKKNMNFFGFTGDENRQYTIHHDKHTTKVLDNITLPEVYEKVKTAISRVSDDNLREDARLMCMYDRCLISWWGRYVIEKEAKLIFKEDIFNNVYNEDKYGNTTFELKINLRC